MQSKKERLIQLYELVAAHTKPVCQNECRVPFSCCNVAYCEMAAEYAKEEWKIELTPTGHPTLPFMGETGCTVPPYLRPNCSLHVCCINPLGFKPGDEQWTKKYFALRHEITKISLSEVQGE